MKPSALASPATRIIPARAPNKAASITPQASGAMAVTFGDGRTGEIGAGDKDLQAFLVWTMLNSECTSTATN